jgi:hypothetical protein
MKTNVDKSMSIVTRITESLSKIKPTESIRLDKRVTRQKRNCSDSSGNSPAKILGSRCSCQKMRRVKSLQTSPEVLTATGRKTMGSGISHISTIILFIMHR